MFTGDAPVFGAIGDLKCCTRFALNLSWEMGRVLPELGIL